MNNVTVIITSMIGAGGTVLSAWIAVRVRTVVKQTDGQLDELRARVALLEEVRAFAAGELERSPATKLQFRPRDVGRD